MFTKVHVMNYIHYANYHHTNFYVICVSVYIFHSYLYFEQLLQTDIDSHKPSVESVNESSAELIRECDPKMARNIQGRLDDLNSRFEHVIVRARARKDLLGSLLDKLKMLLEEVGDLEDWLLPLVDSLESRDISRMELPELGSRLEVSFKYFEICNYSVKLFPNGVFCVAARSCCYFWQLQRMKNRLHINEFALSICL